MRIPYLSASIALLLVMLASACSADRKPEPGVLVSVLKQTEADDIPFLLTDHRFSCNEDLTQCSTSENVAVKWGAGYCEDTESELVSQLAQGDVRLFVDGHKVDESLVLQRDERYERQEKGYCHTWLIKLSDWVPGRKAILQSVITYGGGFRTGEKLEVTISK